MASPASIRVCTRPEHPPLPRFSILSVLHVCILTIHVFIILSFLILAIYVFAILIFESRVRSSENSPSDGKIPPDTTIVKLQQRCSGTSKS
jgi:hypothetical protein